MQLIAKHLEYPIEEGLFEEVLNGNQQSDNHMQLEYDLFCGKEMLSNTFHLGEWMIIDGS